ncbi:GTP-binding protein rho2 [Paraphaeosphaeria sporulosa]
MRYIRTVFEHYVTECRVDGRLVQLALLDTAGREDYERLRPLAYTTAHVILICFSVESPDSLENVKQRWSEEAQERCPSVPIILVGLKKDLREDPLIQEEMRKKSLDFTTPKAGDDMKNFIGARKYLECSSVNGDGVDDVFEAATRESLLLLDKDERRGCCVVL